MHMPARGPSARAVEQTQPSRVPLPRPGVVILLPGSTGPWHGPHTCGGCSPCLPGSVQQSVNSGQHASVCSAARTEGPHGVYARWSQRAARDLPPPGCCSTALDAPQLRAPQSSMAPVTMAGVEVERYPFLKAATDGLASRSISRLCPSTGSARAFSACAGPRLVPLCEWRCHARRGVVFASARAPHGAGRACGKASGIKRKNHPFGRYTVLA